MSGDKSVARISPTAQDRPLQIIRSYSILHGRRPLVLRGRDAEHRAHLRALWRTARVGARGDAVLADLSHDDAQAAIGRGPYGSHGLSVGGLTDRHRQPLDRPGNQDVVLCAQLVALLIERPRADDGHLLGAERELAPTEDGDVAGVGEEQPSAALPVLEPGQWQRAQSA